MGDVFCITIIIIIIIIIIDSQVMWEWELAKTTQAHVTVTDG